VDWLRKAANVAFEVVRYDTFGLLWGCMKSFFHEVKLQIIEDVTHCILSATVQFKNDGTVLCRAAIVVLRRVRTCLVEGDGQFEQLL
jgi:hypothetical protein